MSAHQVILFLVLLFTKHFIIDFPLQTPYQWMNKGTYLHPGGILHSALHAIGTFICAFFLVGSDAFVLACFDFAIHYHTDWLKVKLNNIFKLECNKHPGFWTLLGLDQYVHALTYLGFAYLCS